MRIQPAQNTQNRPKFGALRFTKITNPKIFTAIEAASKQFKAEYKITINSDGKLGALLNSNIEDDEKILKFMNEFFKS